MAVAILDTGTAAYNASATTQNYTFTISSGATSASADIVLDNTQTISSVTWDPTGANQSLTSVGSISCPTTTNGLVAKYGIVNPTAGTSKTLRVVLATATGCSAALDSWTGSATSSVAACFSNALTANGSVTVGTGAHNVGTAAQSGANGDMYVGLYTCPGSISAVSDTAIDATSGILAPAGNDAAYNRFASTGVSHALTCTLPDQTTEWAAISCDIVAAAASLTLNTQTLVQI